MTFLSGVVALLGAATFICAGRADGVFPEPNPPRVLSKSGADLPVEHSAKNAPAVEWTLHRTEDGSHPDGREQEMVWLMNRARSNPAAEGEFLASTGNLGVAGAISFFRVNLVLLRLEFSLLPAKPPAAFDRRLYAAALAHGEDLVARNAQDHDGQFDRVEATGFPYVTLYGSVFSYSQSALYSHAGFNIDWGGGDASGMQPGRGHRVGLMSDTPVVLSLVGVSLVPESNPATAIGPLINTINYGAVQETPGNFNRYLVGTVWEDTNRNGRFDAGEGKGGVRVTPSAGTYFATTTAAGGYALPLTVAGDLTVTFSGGALPVPQTRTVTVSSESVLLDFNMADVVIPVLPLQMGSTVFNPQANQVSLSWSGGTGPYQVQRRNSALSGAWENVGAETTANAITLPASASAGFYRVRGR